MAFTQHMAEELDLLLKFPTQSMMQGLKIHHDAPASTVAAAQRLFDKGIISQPDGGYLTDLGHDLIDHAQRLAMALTPKTASSG
ncbi:TIGR02647 family protein [Aestuariibacter halophilus]|uniref:TIGR02647 family protein n=1 Tax=Fluctibacter halophilus TaxID=226011 RepID=A0ABS8G9L4_9ALTE|nr:TIGR02647 family protein [Aestuariibacter halophilus]MCC2617267.1 TIGR02647 family protein [Aestuariibacter halophilus]